MTAPVHPGGWVDGIGWVALASDLVAGDYFTEYEGSIRHVGGYAQAGRQPVIVTRWADGSTPQAPTVDWIDAHRCPTPEGDERGEGCTGLTAAWCPKHGDCTCIRSHEDPRFQADAEGATWDGSDIHLNDDDCPLHSDKSNHPATPEGDENLTSAGFLAAVRNIEDRHKAKAAAPATPWGQVPQGRYEVYADDDDVIGLTVAVTYPSGWPIVRTDPPFMDACDEFAIGQFIAAALTNATAPEGDQLAELRAARERVHADGSDAYQVLFDAVDRVLASEGVTAPVHPGGWVDGIGWVALGSSLGPSDLFARWQGDPPRPKHPYRMCDRTPVIVTCWADGTVPTWVPSHPDSIQFRLRQFTPHHPVASGRQAMMDAADALDVTHCADGSTPQAPTVDSVAVPRADGAGLIAAERQRQIDAEGWTPEHDDTHTIGELVDAAVCYLRHGLDAEMAVVWPWPWTEDWWKPSDDPIKNLVRAGALIAAEIDRLTRAAAGVSSDR